MKLKAGKQYRTKMGKIVTFIGNSSVTSDIIVEDNVCPYYMDKIDIEEEYVPAALTGYIYLVRHSGGNLSFSDLADSGEVLGKVMVTVREGDHF